ncbi:hypothetical protein FS749_016531 [Ceratobasidium sp. UAMH 11750]|nr:hypothetical protein FS749_016531 [Ceratobasidium sp. UAMH 11750]
MSRAEHDGLDIAKALVADEGVRTEVISKDTMCTIASLLDDRVEYVTRKAIDVVVSFATYADGRTQIFQSEVIKNIINHMKDDALVCNVLDAITELDRLTGLKWPDEMAKDVSKVVVDTLLQKQNENDSQSTKIFYKIVEMIETLVDNDKLLNQMLEEKLFDALLTFPRIGSNEQDAQKRQGGQQKGQKGQGGQEEQGARNGQDKQEGQRNATMSEGPKRKRRGKQKGQQEPKGEGRQDMPKGQMRQQQRGRGRPRSRIHPDYVGRLGKVLSCIQNITKNGKCAIVWSPRSKPDLES